MTESEQVYQYWIPDNHAVVNGRLFKVGDRTLDIEAYTGSGYGGYDDLCNCYAYKEEDYYYNNTSGSYGDYIEIEEEVKWEEANDV